MKIDHENGFALVPESSLDQLVLRELLRKSGINESIQVQSGGPDIDGCFEALMPARDYTEDLLEYTFTPVSLRLALFSQAWDPETVPDLGNARITVEARPEDGRGVFAGMWVGVESLLNQVHSDLRASQASR